MTQPLIIYNPARNNFYRLDARIDKGGEGEVWAGTFLPALPVAIKIIHATANAQQAYGSWFRDQDVHLKCIQHPNVVQTYDQFYSSQFGWVLVMERAQGNLEQVLNRAQPLDAASVYSYGCQLLWGLHHLHTVRVVHRDLKPKNILVFNEGIVKINDFGISKTDLSVGDITRTVLGTKQYLPPELHNLGRWSHLSDIYQVGLILLSLMVGKHVIPAEASDEVIKSFITEGYPRLLAERLIPLHGNLARIIYYMVCRTESLRYRSALSARSDLWNAWTNGSQPKWQPQASAVSKGESAHQWASIIQPSLPSSR